MMISHWKKIIGLSVVLTLGSWTNAFAQASPGVCSNSGSASDPITRTDANNVCWTEPDVYKIWIYEMGLCAATPSLSTFQTSCVPVSTSAAGGLLTVASGTNTPVPGTFTRPPNGSYTHGYIIMKSEFRVTTTKTFDGNMTGKTGTGTTCWSLNGMIRSSGGNGTYDSTTPSVITNGVPATYMAECGTAGAAAPAEITVVQDTFSGSAVTSTADSTGSATTSGATITAYLTDSSFTQLDGTTVTSNDAERLVGFVQFPSAVTLTDSSSTFTVSFKVSEGTTVLGGANHLTTFESGPFVTNITVN